MAGVSLVALVRALLAVAVLVGAAGDVDADGQAASGRQPVERTLAHGGRQRSYLVLDGAATAPAPVVIVLHGGGGNAQNAIRMTGFDRLASREGIVAVFPNGTRGRDSAGRLLTWNAGHCCASAMRDQVDDVGFIAAIIDQLAAAGRADRSRVFVTGMSNGGIMAHRLGRELSARLAGVAPVVAAVFGDEGPPAGPVPAFIVVGAEDEVVPAAGGPLQLRAILGRQRAADRPVAPAIDQAAYWARHNGCGASPTRTRTPAAEQTVWSGCRSGAAVEFHRVLGSGHAWPGGQPGRRGADQPSTAFDATERIWAFFKASRPEP